MQAALLERKFGVKQVFTQDERSASRSTLWSTVPFGPRLHRSLSGKVLTAQSDSIHGHLQILLAWGGVNPGGVEILVAQDGGHLIQGHAGVNEVLATRMAKGVRSDVLQARVVSVLPHQVLNSPRLEPLPTLAHKYVFAVNARSLT